MTYIALAKRFQIDPVAVLEWPEQVAMDALLDAEAEAQAAAYERAKRR